MDASVDYLRRCHGCQNSARRTAGSLIGLLLLLTLLGCVAVPAVRLGLPSVQALDVDADRTIEGLSFSVPVIVNKPGSYTLGAVLRIQNPKSTLSSDIDAVQVQANLAPGEQLVPLDFPGRYICEYGSDGPYVLSELWITDVERPSPEALRANLIDNRRDVLVTPPYRYTSFCPPSKTP